MSGLGVGEAIGATLYIVGGAAYITGVVAVGGVRLLVRAGKAAHKAYVRHEEERHTRIREELKAVEGRLGEEALARHDAVVAAERAMMGRAEEARLKVLELSDEAERSIRAFEEEPEKSVADLEAYLRTSEIRMEALRKADEEAFAEALTADCKRIEEEISAKISTEKKALEEKLDKVADQREAQETLQRNYALEILSQGKGMLRALESAYDCRTLATASFAMVQSYAEDLERSVRAGEWKNAAIVAGIFHEGVQMLHMELERNQALYDHKRMEIQSAAEALKMMVVQTHKLAPEGTPEAIAAYVDEECDAAFWSEGRLPRLWEKAAQIIERLNAFDYSRMSLAGRELQNANALMSEISAEYKRTRFHVASRTAMDDVLVKVDESMDEAGWSRVSDPEYVVLDSTGRYVGTGDPRGDLLVRYENDRGDVRTIVVRNEYNCEGQYVQHIERFVHETGRVDEAQRAQDDAMFNEALKRSLPEEAGVKCVASTIGTKGTPQ